ncbi:MAG: hypothetical protein EHM17_04385 [Verrucomicrobiaceae bacterium]|nr:MAG: hypothetical protein EHM17_04385 [Verrucomicrobiaceae bacterium]
MPHTILVPDQTRARLAGYMESLQTGVAQPGRRLASEMRKIDPTRSGVEPFLDALLNTKLPQIFAESAVAGDGSDWTLAELRLLGDISITMPVTVYDDGRHVSPRVHEPPFPATLVFTPGALLCNGRGCSPADLAEVTDGEGMLCAEGYYRLYERRLLPVFGHVQATAASHGRPALLTIPGLGCGQFAGPFQGQLGAALQTVLERFLQTHGASFNRIRAVYYDPYAECENSRRIIHHISFMVRPLRHGNESKPQLCQPTAYAEDDGDEFSDCMLASMVAWDHVSWPGNDFFAGSRCTDDGVKAAATDSMAVLTGTEGRYDASRTSYLPPPPYRTWGEVVTEKGLRL